MSAGDHEGDYEGDVDGLLFINPVLSRLDPRLYLSDETSAKKRGARGGGK